MLKHSEYRAYNSAFLPLISFLERTPSVKHLDVAANILRNIIPMDSTIRSDYLNISTWRMNDANEVVKRLKTLHANGFFKTLALNIGPPDYFEIMPGDGEMLIREMTSFVALEKLDIYQFFTDAIGHFTQLKELHLSALDDDKDSKAIAINLINLERLHIEGPVEQLLPFLRNSKNLKFVHFEDLDSFENPLNLYKSNCERHIGGMQRKVLIGVCDEQHLATKWKEHNVNYDLVEIARVKTILKYFHD